MKIVETVKGHLHHAIDSYGIGDSRVLTESQKADDPIALEQARRYEEYKKKHIKELTIEEVRQSVLGPNEKELRLIFQLYGMKHKYEGSFASIISNLVEFHSGQIAAILLLGKWSVIEDDI
ncbi:MAG: hypothetical protein Q8936_16640 [Bacillota bacterium]|nr:hypothetical protein [Bacillota bacterium]